MSKKSKTKRIIRHEHGTPNPIIIREEEAMLAAVDKALESSSNSQVIGRNGEIPMLEFMNRYLPYTFCAANGHFVPPSGRLSPQIDVMILDSRYPLLAQNVDGSVLAMLHSVIRTIEIKTRITTRDIEKAWKDSIEIMDLAAEVDGYGDLDSFSVIGTTAFAYRSAHRLDTLDKKYSQAGDPNKASLDIYMLRLQDNDQRGTKKIGVELHFEPNFATDESDKVIGYTPICRASYTPLSDLYYSIVQNGYYTLDRRGHSFSDIGRHIMEYMSWATASWDQYFRSETETK